MMSSPKIYTSGDSIPLILTLSCSKLPSLPQLLAKADSLSIHLIRRAKITTSSGDSLQETTVSKAELKRTDNSSEGVSRSYWVLQLGANQRHISWKVDGSAEVKVRTTLILVLGVPYLAFAILCIVHRPRSFQAAAV